MLTKVCKNFTKDINYWELNPQVAIVLPYSLLYDRDESEDKTKSSGEMWSITFMSDPDEDVNIFFRYGIKERQERLTELFQTDWEDPFIKQCLESYPNDFMDSIEKSLKDTKEYLTERANILKSVMSNRDEYLQNINKIDTAVSKNLKLYEELAEIQQKFLKAKEYTTVKGGRRETKQEKKLI